MSEEKPKEGVKTENDHINLKVAGQDGSVVQFKIKRHTPLSKLMKAYCERQVIKLTLLRLNVYAEYIFVCPSFVFPGRSDAEILLKCKCTGGTKHVRYIKLDILVFSSNRFSVFKLHLFILYAVFN
uniref:Rad60/SUMO-like domain-containing protein n=1 Tax=Naja naja TaxID=35670 RepID=A0A8C7DWQ3_NAJNA